MNTDARLCRIVFFNGGSGRRIAIYESGRGSLKTCLGFMEVSSGFPGFDKDATREMQELQGLIAENPSSTNGDQLGAKFRNC